MERPDINNYPSTEKGFDQCYADCQLYIDFLESKASKPDEKLREELGNILKVFYLHGKERQDEAFDKIMQLIQSQKEIVLPSDEEIKYMQSEESQQDWNELAYKKCFEEGFAKCAKYLISKIKSLNNIS